MLPQTKIHERIHGDLPSFEQQSASSTAVQERFTALTANVNMLCDAVSHPEVAASPKLSIAIA
jgi:centromere/kinetochore protein ZW10